jgi:hypothetical protein
MGQMATGTVYCKCRTCTYMLLNNLLGSITIFQAVEKLTAFGSGSRIIFHTFGKAA